jgi:4-amino-4-deoxy-L-arabinose transferase-like glycosyltransferase
VALAIVVRCVRYFARFPLWEDECFLGVSLYQRDFLGLLQPLEYHQVAPFLFLWLEKAVVALFGFNELALRLPAFLASLASIGLFIHLGRRLLTGPVLLFAVAPFAVSYPATRYAAEAKPYGTDLLVSLVLIVLLVEWLRRPGEMRWLVGLVVWCPLAIGLSLPALFTTGAVSLLLLMIMVRHPEARRWGWWVAYNLALLGGAAALYRLSIRPQMQAELGFMSEQWANAFVPLTSAWALLKWLVTTHTGILFAHPVGDKNFGSTLTTILLAAGIVFLARRRRWTVALLLLLPLALHLVAAALQRYPYGGHVKFSMYAAPMIYLLMGLGCAALLGRKRESGLPGDLSKTAVGGLALFGLIGVGSIASDLVTPYKTTADMRQRALAMWLWHDGNFDDRTVCIKDELGQSFSRRTWTDLGWSAMYLCNKYIYTPRRVVREPRPAYAPAPAQRYLRCVLYRDLGKGDFDQEAFDRWLAGMKEKHRYAGMDRFPLPRHDTRNRRLVTIDYIEIYRFEADPPP